MPSSSREEGVWPSGPKKEKVMTMVIFFHASVENCGGDHAISSRQGFWPSSSRRERSMTMATFLPSLVKSSSGGHGVSSKEEEFCSSYP